MCEFNAFSEMISRLQADESLRRSNEIAIGTGSMKDEDRKSVIRGWEQDSGVLEARRIAAKQNAGGALPAVGLGSG